MGKLRALRPHSTSASRLILQVRHADRDVLSISTEPSSKDQQTLEALAILVALRHWAPRWKDQRVHLAIRTDNVAALTMCCKMQPHSETLGVIARELALDIAASSYKPDDARHIPGIANKTVDYLSRIYAPLFSTQPPTYLPPVACHMCSARGEDWWRARPRS